MKPNMILRGTLFCVAIICTAVAAHAQGYANQPPDYSNRNDYGYGNGYNSHGDYDPQHNATYPPPPPAPPPPRGAGY